MYTCVLSIVSGGTLYTKCSVLVSVNPRLFTRDEFFKEMGIFTESEFILSILVHISSTWTHVYNSRIVSSVVE